ncbi:MAG: hypothetical protein R3B48_00995 [Kofleriaceae bacterium]
MRHASKVMFAPPVMILVGGVVFGTIAPLLGGLLGAVAVSLITAGSTFTAGVAVCGAVDGASRWLLSRHRQRLLPMARVVSDGSEP